MHRILLPSSCYLIITITIKIILLLKLLATTYLHFILFQIESFSCEGGSGKAKVEGSCEVPQLLTTLQQLSTPFNIGFVIGPIAAVLVISLLVIGAYNYKRFGQHSIF